jgi:pyruvate formate lyase activating enzyme
MNHNENSIKSKFINKVVSIPLITEIQRYCLQDGPGIRTTVFIKGCPLKCPWCHNPETQNSKRELYFYPTKCTGCGKCAEICPTHASSISLESNKSITINLDRDKCIECMKCVDTCFSNARAIVGQKLHIERIIQEAISDKPFYENSGGGVTLSGGEPLLYPDFTLEVSKRLKREHIHVAIETSCFGEWRKIKPLLQYVDLFIVDIKTLNAKIHKDIIGYSLTKIIKNINKFIENHAKIRIHIPIIPNFNNTQEDYKAYINYLSNLQNKIEAVDILPFHCYAQNKYVSLGRSQTYQYSGVEDLPGSEILPLLEGLRHIGINVTVGGLVGLGNVNSK